MSYSLEYAYTCIKGKTQERNEDNFWCRGKFLPADNDGVKAIRTGVMRLQEKPFFAVFDGMGSPDRSAEGAYLAADTFNSCYRESITRGKRKKMDIKEFLSGSCQEMNEIILQQSLKGEDISWIGTTAALLGFYGDTAYVCGVGDSRVYLAREDRLFRMTKDHITRDTEGDTGVLSQYLGVDPQEIALSPNISDCRYRKYDRFLLCTDGLSDVVSDKEIGDILILSENAAECTRRLLKAAFRCGSTDNITIITCEVAQPIFGV